MGIPTSIYPASTVQIHKAGRSHHEEVSRVGWREQSSLPPDSAVAAQASAAAERDAVLVADVVVAPGDEAEKGGKGGGCDDRHR